ncbi:MAG: helix-turn-helix domain-containing protein [Desmonostoc geniculatum HA4340-LM1]|nr:helix-turn-helix domain-containing protein [Desmonostoc geniculatum HA4340-LM1]
MDKKAAAEFLGVSTRTIENYASDGKISVTYSQGRNGKQAQYREDDLRALKEELATPVHRSVVAPKFRSEEACALTSLPNSSEIVNSETFGGLATVPPTRVVELLEAISGAQRLALLWNKLVWNLEEAAIATGYSRFHLRQAIALGNLPAQKIGKGWKVRPSDLQEYTNCLFAGKEQQANHT